MKASKVREIKQLAGTAERFAANPSHKASVTNLGEIATDIRKAIQIEAWDLLSGLLSELSTEAKIAEIDELYWNARELAKEN